MDFKFIKLYIALFFTAVSFGQNGGIYEGHQLLTTPSNGGTTVGNLNFTSPSIDGCSIFKVLDGKTWVSVDFGEDYEYGSVASLPFEVNTSITIQLIAGSSGPEISFPLVLTNNKPEGIVFVDLKPFINNNDLNTGLTIGGGDPITGINVSVNVAHANLPPPVPDVLQNLRIKMHYRIENGINTDNNSISNLSHTAQLVPTDKVVTFSWEDICKAPNYEFQLLRLFNTDPTKLEDERIISAMIDWNKALTFQTESSLTSLSITIGEGQGFYIWRVRPIGTFNKGGVANSKNWGPWDNNNFETGTILDNLDASVTMPSGNIFFFYDLDDNINYQYSRMFTEENKQSEQITYATPLNQVKQTQRYFPSNLSHKIITQTILDYSGRPVLNTLPVPIPNEKLNKYKEDLVTTNGHLYRSKHFDTDVNFNEPLEIDATGAFSYYSSLNPDQRIADAQGYPFSRALYTTDGTNRVTEQSGVGKRHMIGLETNGKGKTTKTLYSTPTEDELVALFGDEAPYHENVAKIITIDPNKTTSVSYITKEGKTIATGLTFSEDEDILDKIDSNGANTLKPVIDKMTRNTATEEGFLSAKRITLLEITDLSINYEIRKQILEGLCTNLEIDMDYGLKVEIFDATTGNEVQVFDIPSIWAFNTGGDMINLSVGNITLQPGSYYIQKRLTLNGESEAKIVTSQENMRRLIEPFYLWLTTRLDFIDCEEELQYLFNDIFYFGKEIYLGSLPGGNNGLTNPPTGSTTLPFDCADCSHYPYTFLAKNDQDDPDEFLDYYRLNKENYSLVIYYYEEGDPVIKTIDYGTQNSLGNKIPVRVGFSTPCCEFDVPVNFTPPFRIPSREALSKYKYDEINPDITDTGNTPRDQKLNNSISYYASNSQSGELWPNYNFLTQTSINFKYTEEKNSSGDIINVNIDYADAYPLDFEGYAVSMLYECESSKDSNYNIDTAKEAIYSYMRGWHKPGLLNQMVYHMVSDNYGEIGCQSRTEGPNGGNGNGSGGGSPPIDKYHTCDIPQTEGSLPASQYSVTELAKCWEALVIQIVNELCISQIELDAEASENISDNVDDQDGEIHDDHFDDNIKNFIIRWISKKKLKKAIRSSNINGTSSPEEAAMMQKNNIVNLFLECTGYRFADILNPDRITGEVDTNYSEFEPEFDGNVLNGEYSRDRLIDPQFPLIGTNWNYFTLDPDISGVEYIITPSDSDKIIEDLHPFIFDPVYAFKYYEYNEGSEDYQSLEMMTCYRDPNLCYDELTGMEVPCCGGTLQAPDPCNFCGIGYIECPYTKLDWSCGQRFTFYDMLKHYVETPTQEGIAITCDNYYESTRYVKNPCYGIFIDDNGDYDCTGSDAIQFFDPGIPRDILNDLRYLSEDLWYNGTNAGYIQSPSFETLAVNPNYQVRLYNIKGDLVNATDGLTEISLVEDEAYRLWKQCEGNCDGRRDEFRNTLIKMFEDRCYRIGDCKIDSNDNIVPVEDIEALVDKIVAQCKLQCPLTSYACEDEGCRNINTPITELHQSTNGNNFNISLVDYGVEGPIGPATSTNRSGRLIIYNNGGWEETAIDFEDENITDAPGGVFYKYSYPGEYSIWNVRRSLRYAEFSRWTQSMGWLLDLDIRSMCDQNGVFSQTPPFDPIYNGYIYDNLTQTWVLQNFQVCPMPYITIDNPNAPGDTFVERDQYIKNAGDPSNFNTEPDVPVNSPSVGINHQN